MSVRREVSHFTLPLADYLSTCPPPERGIEVFWLGQAGFLLRTATQVVVIDPYLSDSLAEKYRGRALPHQRMMPPPIQPEQLAAVQHLLITHHHTDHLDGATLQPLLSVAPSASVVVPRASLEIAAERTGLAASRLTDVNAGEQRALAQDFHLHAVRASHETLEQDAAGNYRFLGYVLELDSIRIFHSGDTVPFPGQVEELQACNIDIALLPVNGRTEQLTLQGVPGNLNLQEGLQLCQQSGIRYMIAHHYGLFDFNTADPAHIDAMAQRVEAPCLSRAQLQTRFYFVSDTLNNSTNSKAASAGPYDEAE